MPNLVVDASVAIKWLNPREVLADKANALYADYEQGQLSLLVPAFWDYEVANGINKGVARGDLTEQEGHDAIGFFTGQFDVAQHDFHDRIDTGHQQGTLVFVSGIQMQNITALQGHRLLELGCALPMSQGQEGDEAPAQFAHGAGTQMDMLPG